MALGDYPFSSPKKAWDYSARIDELEAHIAAEPDRQAVVHKALSAMLKCKDECIAELREYMAHDDGDYDKDDKWIPNYRCVDAIIERHAPKDAPEYLTEDFRDGACPK